MLIGSIIAFSGVIFLKGGLHFDFSGFQFGHVMALIAALHWSVYSLIIKHQKLSSTGVPVSALYRAIAFFVLHILFGPEQSLENFALLNAAALGAIVGIGYYCWDIAMKHGDALSMSIFAYFTPLLSTILLVTFSYPIFTANLGIATILIILGTLIASKDKIERLIRRQKA